MNTIIYINLDGFSYSYYSKAKKQAKTAFFDEFASDGFLLRNLYCGIVSITNPMQASILSGAWSDKTHNYYQHYDPVRRQVVKHYRRNDAENVAEAYLRHGLSAISIHQFMLENKPCIPGVKDRAYFCTPSMPSNYLERLNILDKIILRQPVYSGNQWIVYDELPAFIAVYIDDLDALGHNNQEYEKIPIRNSFSERQKDITERLELIQTKLKESVEMCKLARKNDNIVFLVTSDHGMTRFEGSSLFPDLLNRIKTIGISATHAEDADVDTEVVLLPSVIECAIYCMQKLSDEKREKLAGLFNNLEYLDVYFDRNTLISKYGMDDRCPDYLLSPKPFGHFYRRDMAPGHFGASHDSFDETSQHIFGLLFGHNVAKLGTLDDSVSSIDLLPTIAKLVHGIEMHDATGRICDSFFVK